MHGYVGCLNAWDLCDCKYIGCLNIYDYVGCLNIYGTYVPAYI